MSEATDRNEIQVSIVLEEAPSGGLDMQTVRMVGFVMIHDAKMRLSELRRTITEDLDNEQFQMIGTNFKFLKKNFPVSSKQEASMQIEKICINSVHTSHNNSILHQRDIHKTFILQPQHSSQISAIHDTCTATQTAASPVYSKPASNHQSNNHSLIVCNETDEKTATNKESAVAMELNLDELQPFEMLPHHYQYMSHLGASPIMNTSFLSNKANSPDAEDRNASQIQNEEAFPKVTMRFTENHSLLDTLPMQKQNKELGFTVMVRACHRVVSHRTSSNADPTKHALHSFLELERESTHKSLSVFTSFNNNNNSTSKGVSLPSSPPKRDHKQDSDVEPEPSMSPKPVGFFKGAVTTASFISSYVPLSPKSTRLETQLGHKLPRIGPKSFNRPNTMELTNEVDSILKNAMVKYAAVDEENPDGENENDEGSFSISVNETATMHPITDVTQLSDPPNASIVPNAKPTKPQETNHLSTCTPPQTFFWGATQRSNTMRFAAQRARAARAGDHLIDDKIKTKFTVIGHPILSQDRDQDDDDENKECLTHDNGNLMLEFDNATDLIKGLGGVHHSRNHPLWIDLVCDRNTFINIAEHIRPAIHTLTIEDCLTMDCREKLEIFNEYLFICLKTCKSHDNHAATQTINVMIFKTMIITYHLGHTITTHLINDCRYILNKKFGNICPSPSWVGHTIIDNVIDKMMPEVESRVREVETCEQFVFKLCNESQNELLHRMQNVRSWMVLYRSRLWPKSTITHNLLNNGVWRKDFLCDVPQPYWRDINDHVARMVDLLELGTQTLESIQNIFVAKVSLEMTQQSNSLASVGGKLAGVGAVFLPLTVITGIWGMNCRVPFQFTGDDGVFDNDLYGFVIVMLVMLLSSIITWKCVNQSGLG